MRSGRTLVHIPARSGSKRVPSKNLRLLDGRPMIAYAVEAALSVFGSESVFINTDSAEIASLSDSLGCRQYIRPASLGSDETTGEEFTIDFISKFCPDTLVMVSPVCPLVEPADLAAAMDAFESADVDTLISSSSTRMQTFCEGQPVNIKTDGPLAPSQQNPLVRVCNWAITIWSTSVFRESFARTRGGYFGVKRMFFDLDPVRAVKVSEERDFLLAEALLRARRLGEAAPGSPQYWKRL